MAPAVSSADNRALNRELTREVEVLAYFRPPLDLEHGSLHHSLLSLKVGALPDLSADSVKEAARWAVWEQTGVWFERKHCACFDNRGMQIKKNDIIDVEQQGISIAMCDSEPKKKDCVEVIVHTLDC